VRILVVGTAFDDMECKAVAQAVEAFLKK